MKLWIKYMKQRRMVILAWLVFVCVFTVSFALYQLPMMAVGYPALLCLFLGILFLFLDFHRVKQKHELAMRMEQFSDLITESLPAADGVVEEDYQTLIRMLQSEHTKTISHNQQTYAEMVDYYTIWVHQIKTPIASMRLTLQNEDTPLSRQLTNDLFRIEQYVEMVLTYLRLNSESTDYVIKEYDLDGIIRQSVKKYAGEFISRKISLVYEPIHKSVLTDEKWLSFVIEQVLSNALKYTPSGNISITMKPGDELCISDTGIGIAAEDLPRIFERGYTGYNGRMDKKASGIGLYLCKCICTRLGHGIEAQSKIDEGTCISIHLSRKHLEVE